MKKKLYTVAFSAVIAGMGLFAANNIASASPGGPEDPLVSRSYVDMRFNELHALINAMGAGQPAVNTEAIVNQILADVSTFFSNDLGTFSPVFVEEGRVVLADEGTEIILRSGYATAHVPGPDGIVNATTGADIFHGANIPSNNLLIVPREDGRGIRATTEAWFIIRGGFSIQ